MPSSLLAMELLMNAPHQDTKSLKYNVRLCVNGGFWTQRVLPIRSKTDQPHSAARLAFAVHTSTNNLSTAPHLRCLKGKALTNAPDPPSRDLVAALFCVSCKAGIPPNHGRSAEEPGAQHILKAIWSSARNKASDGCIRD